MQVRALFFSILKGAAGTGQAVLELPPGATVASAANALLKAYPKLAQHLPRVAYAVNCAYAKQDAPLNDGDEVALIPPVSGG